MIAKMYVEELKTYLRARGLKLSGRKNELVARVFAAMENGVQPVKTAVEVEIDLKTEYKEKLKIDKRQLPDPFKIPHGWMDEKEGMSFWPMLLYPNIFSYLMFYPSELGSKDLCDYKNSKAYSYYKSGWLQPLMYHNLSGSNFCILKGECRHSQSIHDPFHKLWLIIEKKTAKIRACHCTCMAGMGQTCNHVAAAMYRVEAAVRNGLTNPSCTSSVNEWLPCRKDVAPCKIKDLNFNREDFAQRGKKKRSLVATPKRNFNPLANSTKKLLNLTDVAKALENVAPGSILFTAVPQPKVDFVREIITVEDKPPTDLANIDDIVIMSESKTLFKENLASNMTKENLKHIEVLTHGQSENENWYAYRKGVITASKAHDVLTKMDKVIKGGGGYVNMWSLNQKVSGLAFVNPDIPALKYGRTMEIEAVNMFCDVMKKRHKDFRSEKCGLFLHENLPFIGASPDRIIYCSCCPVACLEVKCPYSINFASPKDPDVNLPYLLRNGDEFKLNRKHKYFTQCQVQMAVTGAQQTYFVVWTPHGMVIDNVSFDKELWTVMKEKFTAFYFNFYLETFFSD